ncbi:MAG: alkaline phosphatase D family protein [Halioglobus sp.]|nr:alkaline phosphatase D family protein [Halioglobus sp.]
MNEAKRRFVGFLTLGGLMTPLLPVGIRPAFARSEQGYPRLIHGPMAGAVQADSMLLWMRASGRFPVTVLYGEKPDLSDARISEAVTAGPEDDYVVRIHLKGLTPNTKYYYRPYVNGAPAKYMETTPPFQFHSAPAEASRFRLGFGSCARWQEFPRQPIWQALELWEPALFLSLGDYIYADTLEPGIMADLYKIQRSLPEYQRFGSSVPQLATWDDHDYGLNNHDMENPIREASYQLFQRYWANPGYGTADTPGVFFQYTYGGVDFFVLDNRYHCTPNDQPDRPDKTLLGAGQKAWLKQALKASSAPFKVLATGGGWSWNPDSFGDDSWTSYRTERDELFDFIRDENISGVILMSGDVHRAEANCIPRSEQGGYDMLEFVSSGLAQDTPFPESVETPEIRLREPYCGGNNAGILEFDLTLEDPVASFNVINISGQTVWDEPVQVRASELVNGHSSWASKVDPELVSPRRE